MINATEKKIENTTKSGYFKPPNTELILNWVEKVSKEVNAPTIISAFTKAGLMDCKGRDSINSKLRINLEKSIDESYIKN